MAFLRKITNDGISIGLAYSLFQKCIRRSLLSEALHYGSLIYHDGTPNALRKRLVQCCLEDMCNWNLAIEIMNLSDKYLIDYIEILCNNKKTHISAWCQRVALHYAINDTKFDQNNSEMIDMVKLTLLDKNEKYKEIRSFLGKYGSKLYSFMGKSRLVWTVKILCDNRSELNYQVNKVIEEESLSYKFDKIPKWDSTVG